MSDTKPFQPSSSVDITRRVKEDHERILALFHQYRASPPDSRQALVEQILLELALHLEMEEDLVFEKLRNSGPEGRKRTRAIEVERKEIKAMILELQQSEGDDDQAWDEFFVDVMKSVQELFTSEEHELLPLADRSLDA
jgi:hemerythrin superfamily protein